jgi:hypothetical protein
MILRSLSKHITDQNWFAVVLDFLIVVVGVFIGIQVANWNEASRASAKETIVLEQLHAQFTDTVADLREAKVGSTAALAATLYVLKVIRTNVEPEDKPEFLKTLRSATGFSSGPPEPITLIELISSGVLSDLGSAPLRTALMRYHQRIVLHEQLVSLTLTRISTPHDGVHAALYLDIDAAHGWSDYDWQRLSEAREQLQVLTFGKRALDSDIDELIKLGDTVLAEIGGAQ